jgi:hypothetical protein
MPYQTQSRYRNEQAQILKELCWDYILGWKVTLAKMFKI